MDKFLCRDKEHRHQPVWNGLELALFSMPWFLLSQLQLAVYLLQFYQLAHLRYRESLVLDFSKRPINNVKALFVHLSWHQILFWVKSKHCQLSIAILTQRRRMCKIAHHFNLESFELSFFQTRHLIRNMKISQPPSDFFLERRPLSRQGRPTGIRITSSASFAPGVGVC